MSKNDLAKNMKQVSYFKNTILYLIMSKSELIKSYIDSFGCLYALNIYIVKLD